MPMLSGQTVVTTAGTAVPLGTTQVDEAILIKALDTNTGVIAVGNDGADDVTVSNGYRLLAGETVIIAKVDNLSKIYLDSSVNGEGVSWITLDA